MTGRRARIYTKTGTTVPFKFHQKILVPKDPNERHSCELRHCAKRVYSAFSLVERGQPAIAISALLCTLPG
jgi:hypothetical protein